MNLTDEQQQIVDATVPSGTALKAIAYAGTGKTSTLVKVAEKYPNDDVLYLAFNKSVEQEAAMRFPCNTTAKTGHALAWKYVGYKFPNLSNVYNWQLGKAYGLSLYEASLLLRSFESFLNSADTLPCEEHIEPDSLHRLDPTKYLFGMVDRVELLWDDMQAGRNNIPMSHSGYLKMFQLAVSRGEFTLGFPTILLDEAQDTNPVMLKLMLDQLRFGSRVYFVGDPYQQIYSWRGALDAMTKIDCPEFRITQSFRFGDEIAKVGSKLLQLFFGENTPLRGLGTIHCPPIKKHTIITRTNAGLINAAYGAAQKGATIHIIGEQAFQQTMSDLDDIFALWSGKRENIQAKRIAMHPTFAKIKEYAEETIDVELKSKISTIEDFGSQWPEVTMKIKTSLRYATPANIVLTTTHKAKGLEWDSVVLWSDFAELFHLKPRKHDPGMDLLLKRPTRKVTNDEEEIHPEEVNLLYVAATRAKHVLTPTNDLQRLIHFEPNAQEKRLALK